MEADGAPHPAAEPDGRGSPAVCTELGRPANCKGYMPARPMAVPAGNATPERAPEPIQEPDELGGTREMLGSKPLFSLRRLGKLMGLGIARAVPGFLVSGFLPPGNPARAPVLREYPVTSPARECSATGLSHK